MNATNLQRKQRGRGRRHAGAVCTLFCGAAFLVLSGCSSAPSRSASVQQTLPGSTVRQGQAVWKTGDKKPEVAGDVVIATHPSGGSFVQFSKTLPILSARISPSGWEFETVPEGKRYSGRGKPPRRIVWLQLLRVLEGQEISERWSVAHPSDRYVALEDPHTGERLEVQLQ